MAKLTLNLENVSTTSEPVPAGTYQVEVVDADIKEGKSSGKPYLWTHLKITGEENANRRLFWQGTLDNSKPDALGITFSSIEALLLRECAGVAEFELDTDDLISKVGVAVVDIETSDEYGTKNVVKYIRPVSGEALTKAMVDMEVEAEKVW